VTGDAPPVRAVRRPAARLAFLDALRGCAALWVVLYHVHAGGQAKEALTALPTLVRTVLFDGGHFGVPVFFVLSGFVIAHSIGNDRVDARYVGRFALRRAIRLDIPYWAAIALTLALLELKLAVSGVSILRRHDTSAVLAHMFYLQEFLGLRDINPVFWTLTYEIQFYLLFCALLAVAHRSGVRRLMIPFTLAAATAIVWPLFPALHLRGLSLSQWHGFLLGAFAAWVVSGTLPMRWFALYAALLVGTWTVSGEDVTLVCLATVIMILLVDRAGGLATWLAARPLQFLGRISYSLYLLHVPISGAAFHVTTRVLGGSPLAAGVSIGAVLLINLGAAQIFWWATERPSIALARRMRTR